MVEGKLELARSEGRQVLVRSAAGVSNQTIGMHHYAAASLGTPAADQAHLPMFARAQTLRCDVHAGEVLFTPAYWWHEVRSEADEARGHSSIGINWFYERRAPQVESWAPHARATPHIPLLGPSQLLPADLPQLKLAALPALCTTGRVYTRHAVPTAPDR